MGAETSLTTVVSEKSTAVIGFTVQDEDGNAIAGSSLTTLTVTLFNRADGSVINSRTATNILGANGGSVNESGVGEWEMSTLDNVIVDSDLAIEKHVAEFAWTYSGKTGRHRVVFPVVNFEKVT